MNAGPLTSALAGLIELIAGTGFGAGVKVKLRAAEVPPPGAGVCTFTLAVPAVAKSAPGIVAESEVLELKVVSMMEPFQ